MAAALSKTRVLILIMTHDKEIISGGGGGSSLSCTDPLVGLFWIVRGRNDFKSVVFGGGFAIGEPPQDQLPAGLLCTPW